MTPQERWLCHVVAWLDTNPRADVCSLAALLDLMAEYVAMKGEYPLSQQLYYTADEMRKEANIECN